MLASNISTAIPPLSVVRIEVERLFGRYTYTLTNPNQNSQLDSSLIILYGDNGSGKTTILKLLFHLLSPAQKHSHLQFLLKTPFARFSVFLANGTHIAVNRKEGNLTGAFELTILPKGIASEVDYQLDNDNELKEEKDNKFFERLWLKLNLDSENELKSDDFIKIEKFLTSLQFSSLFLGDSRVLESDIFETSELLRRQKRTETYYYVIGDDIHRSSDTQPSLNRELTLKTSIQRTEQWVREQVLKGSNAGEANVHSIYEEIIARIVNSGESVEEELQNSPDELIDSLKIQESRSNDFSRFGLMSPLSTQKLVHLIQSAHENTHPIILDILKPYLDSVKARMDALQDTHDLLKLFVNTINQVFFRDKNIRLDVQKGLAIATEEGIELEPEMLSSGEKQLLLLFCNTLAARDKATIFIIDEPEISLNIKWQRQLIRALLDLTKGSQVQFILATHSFELLSQYRHNVVKLENQGH